jgi:hypothetical protein
MAANARRAKTSTNGVPESKLDLPRVHSTGKKTELRDTSMRPYHNRKVDDHIMGEAKANPNHATDSSPYMRGVRRAGS